MQIYFFYLIKNKILLIQKSLIQDTGKQSILKHVIFYTLSKILLSPSLSVVLFGLQSQTPPCLLPKDFAASISLYTLV